MSNFIERFKGKTQITTKEGLISSLSKSPSGNLYITKQTPLSESRFEAGVTGGGGGGGGGGNSSYSNNLPSLPLVPGANTQTNQISKPFFVHNGSAIVEQQIYNKHNLTSGSPQSLSKSNSVSRILADAKNRTPVMTRQFMQASNESQFQLNNLSLLDANRTPTLHRKQGPPKEKLDGIVQQWKQGQSRLMDQMNQNQKSDDFTLELKKTGSLFDTPNFVLKSKNPLNISQNAMIFQHLTEKSIMQQVHNPFTIESIRAIDVIIQFKKLLPNQVSFPLTTNQKQQSKKPTPASSISGKVSPINSSQPTTFSDTSSIKRAINEEQVKKLNLKPSLSQFPQLQLHLQENNNIANTPVYAKKQNSSRMLFADYMQTLEEATKQQQGSPISRVGQAHRQLVRKQGAQMGSSRNATQAFDSRYMFDQVLMNDTTNSKPSKKSHSQPVLFSREEDPKSRKFTETHTRSKDQESINEEEIERYHINYLNRVQQLHTNQK